MSPNETTAEVGASTAGDDVLLAGNASTNSPSDSFLQAPIPSFFEMVAENCAGHLQAIRLLAEVCATFLEIGDPQGFVNARRKLIAQARAFSDISRPISEPRILDHERADRLDVEAAKLEGQAIALQAEAAEIRAVSE